ncbi:MAG TPA: glycosyltransferase family 2 protein [Acidimicrobiales bacterium]|nr:glycosyltransferase family 2 protein [Acidimicrobiales bacterium]
MDAQAPAVVAVVVTRDPGPWLEESLAALARQDYPELSVLVLVAGGSEDPTARVGAVFPDAFVRRLPDWGFGAAANEALGMVEGASYYLFCHDDVVPRRDAVSLMVEESFRSNAGIVTPKFVRWDDPGVLLHVGLSADKTGAMVERLSEGEVDHGQHDNVRDVFVAPEGCTLVRADLFAELGGYDPVIAAMAGDLDLSWRAHVAGARVVVCPDAAVRHLEAVAGGVRPDAGVDGSPLPSDQTLLRRHELRTVLKCYGAFHLLRVLPQIVVLGLGEMGVALAARHRARARTVWDAWRWNFAQRAELRRARRRVQRSRQVHDSVIRGLQSSGSARLSAYLSNIAHIGFDATHRQMTALAGTVTAEAPVAPELTGSVGGAFSEDEDFDELDDLGRRSRRPGRPRILASRRSRLVAMVMVAVLLLLGSRDLLNGRLPLVGQFVPLLSWSGTWHQFFSGWQPAGLGTTAPASGAFGALGVLGTVLLGGMGLVQKVLILGCLPVGAWGVSRLVRPIVSRRAGLVAAIAYLGLPLAYDALAGARVDGLVAFALTPWLIARLARAGGLVPFVPAEGERTTSATRRARLLSLAVLLAVGMAFAPAMVIVVLLCALALSADGLGSRGARRGRRVLAAAAGAIAAALVLSAPWVVGTAFAGSRVLGVFGLPASTNAPLSWASLVRFHVGPIGGSPLSWLLLVAALFPLLVGAGPRLAWAGRLWTLAGLAWVLALAVERGWTGSFAPSVDVLLAPAAVAVAACVGLGVSAFETDLAGHRFGWRQAATAVMVAAVAVGVVPVVAEVGNGRWGVTPSGFEVPLSYLDAAAAHGPFRVLWLGDPRTLPLGGWSAGRGLAYATSEDGLPTALDWLAPASPGPAATLAGALGLAEHAQTVHLGRLLAPAAVRYVVVLGTVAPAIPGVQAAQAYPPPAGLVDALAAQLDLREIPGGEGFTVFQNTAALPARGERGRAQPALPAAAATPSLADVAGWRAILPGPAGRLAYVGRVSPGTVFSSSAPAGSFQLVVNSTVAARQPAFGWASQFKTGGATAELRFHGNVIVPLAAVAQFVLWVVVAWFLIDTRFALLHRLRRRRGVERRHPARRRARRRAAGAGHPRHAALGEEGAR